MNTIAFSLYGSDRKYTWGALRNSELMHSIYPGWQMVVYYDGTVPAEIIHELDSNGVMLLRATHTNKMTWRFQEHDRLQAGERYLIRDADSRIGKRDADGVQTWIESGKLFHSIRDHPHHIFPMMGATWGGTARSLFKMEDMVNRVKWSGTEYCAEQFFLSQYIWPIIKSHTFSQDSCCRHIFPESKPFPPTGYRFVGEVYCERNLPREHDWQMRAKEIYG